MVEKYLEEILRISPNTQESKETYTSNENNEYVVIHLIAQTKEAQYNIENKCFTINGDFGFHISSQLSDDKIQQNRKCLHEDIIEVLWKKINDLQKELNIEKEKNLEERSKHKNCNLNFENVNLRLKSLEHMTLRSYDGSITWKIDSYTLKKGQAANKKGTCLHSPISLTSRYGYQFCARVYLNGDGMGFGTHLSLYFVLMKSEFDNILEWPFIKTIEFSLINQENPSKTFTDVFNPPAKSNCCQKPKKPMNIAAGCPKLMRCENVENDGFLKDDSLFIRVRVLDRLDLQ